MAIPPDLLQSIERLDPLPLTVQRLVRSLDDPRTSVAQVADLVQHDPAVAASVLRLANSAAFGGWTRTESLREAVLRLGLPRLLEIVLGDSLRRMQGAMPLYDLAEDELWVHSAAAALAARALARECPRAGIGEIAGIAALVHDIGKLVMVRFLKVQVDTILALRDSRGISFVEAEHELFGTDHAEVGGELARRWDFPREVQDAIAQHHRVPLESASPTVDAVVIANLVAKAIGTGIGAEGMDLRVDDRSAQRLGLDFSGFSRACIQTAIWLKDLRATYG
jgi:putative nucleotidyltransferase with HDIG domain